MKNWKTWLSRAGTVILIIFAILVFYRYYVLERQAQTAVQVNKIHATKLTLDDVMGTHLPSLLGRERVGLYDATIQGLDMNKNGIRDDVELAIFAEYPKSAKTRNALLQYAMALQTEMTLPLENTGTVTATIEYSVNNATVCMWSLSSRGNITKFLEDIRGYTKFVDNLQLNTAARIKYQTDLINNNLKSFGLSGGQCDIDPKTFAN